MKHISVQTTEAMQMLGEGFAGKVSQGGVVALYGDLGAGKTTFVQGIAKGLGITRRIISPTFVIVRQYEVTRQAVETSPIRYFYHIDLYRMNSKEDLESLGLAEILMDETNIVVIEWAERLGDLLPAKRWDITISYEGEGRRLAIEKTESVI